MALSADTPRHFTSVPMTENALPVQGSTTIYAGSALSMDSNGEVGPIAASESFVGFARKGVDNSAGSAGDTNVAVIVEGEVELVVTGVNDNDDIGDIVYATDDNTFTLTASSAHVKIGRVSQIVDLATGKCRVRFKSIFLEHPND